MSKLQFEVVSNIKVIYNNALNITFVRNFVLPTYLVHGTITDTLTHADYFNQILMGPVHFNQHV